MFQSISTSFEQFPIKLRLEACRALSYLCECDLNSLWGASSQIEVQRSPRLSPYILLRMDVVASRVSSMMTAMNNPSSSSAPAKRARKV